MQSVNEKLATDYGLMLCAPPYENMPCAEIRSIVFNKGVKENCGIFNHTQGWAVMAETMLGHGDRAFKYFRSSMPASFNDNGRDPRQRAVRLFAIHAQHLQQTLRRLARPLAHRRRHLGVLRRDPVHPGHPARPRRPAH